MRDAETKYNSTRPQAGGYKVLIEGFEIKATQVSITMGVGQIPTAQVAILPHAILRRLRLLVLGSGDSARLAKTKPKVHIFYYDNTVAETRKNKKAFTDALKGRLSLTDFSDMVFWKLIFDGEMTGMSFSKTPESKMYQLLAKGQPYVLDTLPTLIENSTAPEALIANAMTATGANATLRLINTTGVNTTAAVVGLKWRDPLQMVQRFLAPIQIEKYDGTSTSAMLLQDNDFLPTQPFGDFSDDAERDKDSGKYTPEENPGDSALNGAILTAYNANGNIQEYYKPYLQKNNIFQRFFQPLGLHDLLYWADATNRAQFFLLEDFRKNLVNMVGQHSSLWRLIVAALGSVDYRVLVNSTPSYINRDLYNIGDPSRALGGGLRSCIVMPDLHYTHVPACNIIFPCQNTQLGLSEDHSSVLTRLKARYNYPTGSTQIAEGGLAGILRNNFFSPPELTVAFHKAIDQDANTKDKKTSVFAVTEEEKIRGVVEGYEEFPPLMDVMIRAYMREIENKGETSQTNKSSFSLFQSYTDYRFYTRKYENNTGEVGGPFNPNVVPGFPTMIMDTEDNGYHLLGFITAVTHTMSVDNQSTSIQVSHLRTIEDDNEMLLSLKASPDGLSGYKNFIETDLSHDKMDTLYKETLGCRAVNFREPIVEGTGGGVDDEEEKEDIWRAVHISKGELNFVAAGVTPKDNFSYIATQFPAEGSPAKEKFHSYSRATKFGRRPLINLLQFYKEFLRNANRDMKLFKIGHPEGMNSEQIAEPFIVVKSASYFNSEIQEVMEVYFDELRTRLIYRG